MALSRPMPVPRPPFSFRITVFFRSSGFSSLLLTTYYLLLVCYTSHFQLSMLYFLYSRFYSLRTTYYGLQLRGQALVGREALDRVERRLADHGVFARDQDTEVVLEGINGGLVQALLLHLALVGRPEHVHGALQALAGGLRDAARDLVGVAVVDIISRIVIVSNTIMVVIIVVIIIIIN